MYVLRIGVLILLGALLTGCGYNRLQQQDEQVTGAWYIPGHDVDRIRSPASSTGTALVPRLRAVQHPLRDPAAAAP